MTTSNILLFISFLILLNGFFSTAEFSIVSSRKSKLQTILSNGDSRAKDVLLLQENPTSFIIVIQIGLNIIAILSGIFGEQSLMPIIADFIKGLGFDFNGIELVSSILVVFCITSLFIIFGELIPKKIAYLNPEKYACILVSYFKIILFILKPLVYFYAFFADLILKLFNINPIRINDMTFEDVSAIINEGVKTGVLEKNEYKIIENVLALTEKNIYSVMTKKDDVKYLDINLNQEQIKKKILSRPHARFLVCDGEVDNMLGYVDSKDILARILNEKSVVFNRESLKEQGLKQILILPEVLNLLDVLDKFRETRQDIACVINEFGKVVGIITVNDVLSTLMGSVLHNEDTDGLIVKRENNSWLIDGKASIEDVMKLFHWKELEGSENFETISGFLMYKMKCLPKKAQKYEFNSVIFEIVDIDGYRIDEVMATIKE